MRKSEALTIRAKIEHAAEQQSNEDALKSIELFRPWSNGENVAVGNRRKDNNAYGVLTLYECIQAHRTQESWHPKDTPSLWKVVSIEDGSKEHPIHFSQGMAVENGKYYMQYDVEYLCIRDSGIALYADLKDLVGNYVEVAD